MVNGAWGIRVLGGGGVANYQGFDYFYGHLNQDQAHFYYPDYLWENDQIKLLSGNRGGKRNQYTHDLFTEKALDFIDHEKEDLFFLYLSYTIPHWSDYARSTPDSQIVPTDATYTNKDWPQTEKNYAAMITRMDRDVGRIMEKLKVHGLDSNILVFFTSDNGPCETKSHDTTFFNSSGPFRGVKREMNEGGIRVPMIARWPGKVPEGKTSDQMWAFWDLMPTLADFAGLPKPDGIDGISMMPTLLGKKQKEQHEYLYWDYGHCRLEYMQAVRVGNWKGIRPSAHAPIQLYDIAKDPREENDVSKNNPDIVELLDGTMAKAVTPSPQYPIGVHYICEH